MENFMPADFVWRAKKLPYPSLMHRRAQAGEPSIPRREFTDPAFGVRRSTAIAPIQLQIRQYVPTPTRPHAPTTPGSMRGPNDYTAGS